MQSTGLKQPSKLNELPEDEFEFLNHRAATSWRDAYRAGTHSVTPKVIDADHVIYVVAPIKTPPDWQSFYENTGYYSGTVGFWNPNRYS